MTNPIRIEPTPQTQCSPVSGQSNASAPLTRSQESLYFLDQLTKGLPVYHMPQAFRLHGRLDLDALTHALNCIVQRHLALRVSIIEDDSGVRQQIGSSEEMSLSLFDLTDVEPGSKDELLQARIRECVAEPFKLAEEPAFRVELFRLSADEHVLLLILHHIVGDMSSFHVLYSELTLAYNAFRQNKTPELPGDWLQFTDYAARQRQRPVARESIEFWRTQLADHGEELNFPLDYARPPLPSFKGAIHYFEIPRKLTANLKQLARSNKSSMYMLTLAALEVLLFRYTQQSKFTICTPFSERVDLELENTIGYLVNLLPVPCRIEPNATFLEVLALVRQTALESLAHSEISFREILESIGMASDNPKPALARIVFQYFTAPSNPLSLDGLTVESMPTHTGTSKFDLCITFNETSNGIAGDIEFDSDLFDASSIERFSRHFTLLLEAISKNPNTTSSDLSFTGTEERQLIESWGKNRSEYPNDSAITELFETQSKLTPTAIALTFNSTNWTYDQLRQRADNLSSILYSNGVKPGDFVGVCLDRSPDLIASLLAILKCGAAFVPIDAKYPADRIKYILENAALRLTLCDKDVGALNNSPTKVLSLAALESKTTSLPEFPKISPEAPAYVMYTSGSTGNPKAVVVPHRAVIRLVKNTNFATLSPAEKFLAFAPISFDASTLEIWGALLNGAQLVIYPPTFESIEQFESILKTNRVTTLWLTAGLFNTIIDKNPAALSGIRQLLIGGDVLSVDHVRRAIAALPETSIINGYGPTENTTFTCCYQIPRQLPEGKSIPIGTPIANTEVYILDPAMKPVPIGVPGTLFAGGDGLSLGYLNDSELTKERFVQNPFDPSGQSRLYNTGDQARWLANGTIEFLGRRDLQVKIRGFRIELGEIETVLRKAPGVVDAAVVVLNDPAKSKSLAAFVVPDPKTKLQPNSIYDFLSERLPAHAVPSRIVPTETLPLNSNGKVDRKALAALALTDATPDTDHPKAASTPTEEKIAAIWRELLKVQALGVTDNFFHLGGDSLLATRAISQINRSFDCKLTLTKLFQSPTVRGISNIIESSRTASETPSEPSAPSKPKQAINVETLSDAEVDALLNELISE